MKESGLILRSDFLQESYLLTRIYKTLDLSEEKRREHLAEITQLAQKQFKEFGGNWLSTENQRKAIDRALKLINLGLEYAAKKAIHIEEDGELFDLSLAKKILLFKPITKIYEVGEQIFESDKSGAEKLLAECEIEIQGLYFRLISAVEYEILLSTIDLDFCMGTLKDHRKAISLANKIKRLFDLIPYLPINDATYLTIKHLGSSIKGIYPPGQDGLITAMLLSLIISCLFKTNRNFLDDEWITEDIDKLVKDLANEMSQEVLLQMLQSAKRIREQRLDDKKLKLLFFADFLAVGLEEVHQFADLLYYEPEKFGEKVDAIEDIFIKYFLEVRQVLHLKEQSDFEMIILDALRYTEKKVQQEVTEFYKSIGKPDMTNAEVAKFWSQRLCFKRSAKSDQHKGMGIGLLVQQEVDPVKLAKMPLDYILNATRYFVNWPADKQEMFVKEFNPNQLVFSREKGAEKLIVFLRNLTPDAIGWPKEKEKYESAETVNAISVYSQKKDWLIPVMQKIGWERVNPYFISELWCQGSDQIREYLFANREKLKITMPALKSYYLEEHHDLRLLVYALEKLVNEDKLRSERTWQDLFYLAKELPKAKRILELKYKEWKKNKAEC